METLENGDVQPETTEVGQEPSQEEMVARAEYEQVRAEAERLRAEAEREHREVERKEGIIRKYQEKQRAQGYQSSSPNDEFRKLLRLQAKMNPDIAEDVANIERSWEEKERQTQIDAYRQTAIDTRAEMEDSIKGAGLDPQDERFEEAFEKFEIAYASGYGNYDFARKAVTRELRKSEIKAEEPNKAAISAEALEKARKEGEEAAMNRFKAEFPHVFQSDTAGTSAPSGKGYLQASKDYADGKLSAADFRRIREKEGII